MYVMEMKPFIVNAPLASHDVYVVAPDGVTHEVITMTARTSWTPTIDQLIKWPMDSGIYFDGIYICSVESAFRYYLPGFY